MHVLTVRQPWAWSIVAGIKRIENRSRPTRHRGPILIHAGSSRRSLDVGLAALQDARIGRVGPFAFGAIIGICEIVDCVRVEDVAGERFAEGPWCWLLAGARLFDEPIPCPGRLSLWRPSAELETIISSKLASEPPTVEIPTPGVAPSARQ
jgi:hypothetical protein